MKKSISWIMTICLSSIFIFSYSSNAASISPSFIGLNSVYLDLIETSFAGVDSTDNPLGNYVIATYKGYHSSKLSFSGTDGYTSGYSTISMDFSVTTPSGATNNGTVVSSPSFSGSGFYASSRITGSTPRTTSLTCNVVLDNIWNTSTVQITNCEILYTCYFPYTGSNTPDPSPSVFCSISAQVSGSLTKTPEPQEMGLVSIISTAINNGDFSGKVGELVDLLTLIKNNNSTYYTNILAALNTENGWLEEIFTELDNWDQIWWPAIYAENQTQSSRLATVLSNLQTIISDLVLIDSNNVTWLTRLYNKVTDIYNYMQKSDQGATQAANAADQAAAQASQIAAVPRPNANAIINEGVSRIDTDISSGFSVIGAILNQQWYIWLLMIVISLAFVSYLMYGKGV